METLCSKCAPKASLGPVFYFGKQPETYCMQEYYLKIRYFERGLSKTF